MTSVGTHRGIPVIFYIIVQERESYKQVIESYESEMTVPIGQVTNNRVKQLEQIVEGYRQQLASLEEELHQKNQLLGQTKVQCHQVCWYFNNTVIGTGQVEVNFHSCLLGIAAWSSAPKFCNTTFDQYKKR